MNLVKEDVVFTVCYDQVALTLVVTYPEEANVELYEKPDPFEGFTELQFNEGINTKTSVFQSAFKPVKILLNQEHSYRNAAGLHSAPGAVLSFEVLNTGLQAVELLSLYSDVVLHYINEDNHYQYDLNPCTSDNKERCFFFEGVRVPSYQHPISTAESLASAHTYAASFDVPAAVLTSTEGTLAVTFTFIPTNTNYVVYIRRPAE